MTAGYDTYVTSLEERKKRTGSGVEYWTAREVQGLLGYDQWRNFVGAIERARMACESAGVNPENHFVGTSKKVPLGSGAERAVDDYFLTRYACYLIAMNADPGKAEVGFAQTYFAVETRKQEVQKQLSAEEKRLELRQRVRSANKNLNSVAQRAGVKRFGIFHDAGYRGLYGGLGMSDIKALKKIPAKEDLLDCIGRAELAANEFRITQTEQKIARDNVLGEESAVRVHGDVGRAVRRTIEKIGGTMPEALPAEPSVKKLAATRRKKLPPATS